LESVTAGSLETSGSIVHRLQEYKRPSYFKGPLPPPMSLKSGKYSWNASRQLAKPWKYENLGDEFVARVRPTDADLESPRSSGRSD
jgi:hypothetical protein